MSFMTPQIRDLLRDAENSQYECQTTRLWEHIFTRKIFKDESWIVSSQQPPTPAETGDLRRVDLMVEKWTPNGNKRVLYMEAKRANPTPEELITVEYQGFTAAVAHCEYFNEDRVPIVTGAGGLVRLWIYERHDDYLTPWSPATGDGMGAINEYAYLDSQQGYEAIRKLKYIRDHNIPPANSLPSNCSPRPTHVTLPHGWEMVASSGFSGGHEQTYHGNWAVPATPAYEQEAGSSAQGAEKPGPIGPVSLYIKNGKYRFIREDGKPVETTFDAWDKAAILVDNERQDCWVYVGRTTGVQYYALSLP